MEIILGIIIGILWHIGNGDNHEGNEDWAKIRKNLLKDMDKEEKEGIKREEKG